MPVLLGEFGVRTNARASVSLICVTCVSRRAAVRRLVRLTLPAPALVCLKPDNRWDPEMLGAIGL